MQINPNKIRCNYPHDYSKLLTTLQSTPLIKPICQNQIYQWSYNYSLVVTFVFVVVNLIQCIHLCFMRPDKLPRRLRSFLNINILPDCGFFKVIVHDIRLLCYAFALEANGMLLYNLIMENYAYLLVYLAMTGALLLAKMIFTVFNFMLSPANQVATEFTYRMIQAFLLVFNWSQICCTVFNYFDNCLFVDQYSWNNN